MLKTGLLAGASGLEEPVNWAHTSDVPDPWNWLGEGDLLLTTGHNIPSTAKQQLEFVRSLSRAGMVRIAIGEAFFTSPLTAEVKNSADELGLPILETAHEVPFALALQTGAEHSATAGTALIQIMRIYDTYRQNRQNHEQNGYLLDVLGKETMAKYHVLDLRTSTEILPSQAPLSATLITESVEHLLRTEQRIPKYTRIALSSGHLGVALPLIEDQDIALVALAKGPTRPIELQLLQHVAALLHGEAVKPIQQRQQQAHLSAQLLEYLLRRSIAPEEILQHLHEFGLSGDRFQIVCVSLREAYYQKT